MLFLQAALDRNELLIKHLFDAVVFSITGIIILMLAFYIFDRLTPGSLRKEVVENKNIALAITVSAFMLGVSIIVASAIKG